MSNHSVRDYELDDEVDASEPARLKALADPLRMQICDLVLERAMSVTELAERVARPKGTVAYHVDVLTDAGLLKVVRTRRVRAVEERFYGRVARTIVFPHDDDDSLPFLREALADFDVERHRRDDVPGLTTIRHARIPFDRAEEYRRQLLALALEFIDEPRDGDVVFGMYLALYPTTRPTGAAAETPAEDGP
jgi:DNA-binding transcriptional ArsR family regulator